MNLHRHARRIERRAQRGVVLIFGLIALVIMLIGTAALVRSMNTSLFNTGNFAFKRDLTNQGERAIAQVMAAVETGPLATETARESDDASRNYSASILPTNAQGIPLALLSDGGMAGVASAANDIVIADMAVTVRYVVDRLCMNDGPVTADGCTQADDNVPVGGSTGELINAMDSSSGGIGAVKAQVVYRVSIRVEGPRRTQSFFQTTFRL
jgi:type IV pilus assembly protein PilX